MIEKYNKLQLTPELEELIRTQSEKYENILTEWQTPNNNGETKVITESRMLCNIMALEKEYAKYYLEEWAEDIFFFEAFLHFNDTKSGFRTFFSQVSKRKIADVRKYYKAKNRNNLIIDKESLDKPIDDNGEDNRTLEETYVSEWDSQSPLTEDEHKILEEFRNSLSDLAKRIIDCRYVEDMKKKEILEYLNITEKEYKAADQEIRRKSSTYEMMSLNQNRLDKNNTSIEEIQNNTNDEQATEEPRMTKEKNKIMHLSTTNFLHDVGRKLIRTDLSVQRVQGIWTPEMVGNLITTVLSGYPFPNIICAEDCRSGDVFIIDGGQRTDALFRFKNNLIPINKKSEHLNITYDEPEYDENGDIKEGPNGFGVFHPVTVNVGGMYYKDLPSELRDNFDRFELGVEKFLSCTIEDMEWHMRRYNNMKPMTASQRGLTYLGMDLSKSVIAITKESNFFKNYNVYTKLSSKSFVNGDFNRIVNESVMAINFLDNWEKKQTDLNSFLKINASKAMVSEIDGLLNRLVGNGVEAVKEMFTTKNSFIWITLFKKFDELGLEDNKFIEFMIAFRDSLHEKELNGVTYDVLDKKATKDKTTVIAKINHLEGLMREYFDVDGDTPDNDEDTDEIDEIGTEVNTDEVDRSDIEVVNEVIEVADESDNSVEVEEVPFEVELEKEMVEAATGEEYPLPNIADDTIINQPVMEAEWIKKEEDAKNGISPNADILRAYVEEFYDNEYGANVKDMVSEADAKRMAIETMLIYSSESDLSMEHMAEYCSEPFGNSHFEKMKDIVRASKEVEYFAENVEDTAIFEDYENYPMLTLLMIYMVTNRQKITYKDEEIINWLNELTPRFDDLCVKAKSKTDIFRAMITNLKDYKAKNNVSMVEKKKVNIDF